MIIRGVGKCVFVSVKNVEEENMEKKIIFVVFLDSVIHQSKVVHRDIKNKNIFGTVSPLKAYGQKGVDTVLSRKKYH